jgi:hypothetical protein
MSPDTILSRRGFLASGLAAATLPNLQALRADETAPISRYSAPDIQFLIDHKGLASQQPCEVAQRLDNPLSSGKTVKIFVDVKGDYNLRPIDTLVKNGWVSRHHVDRNKTLTFRPNPQAGDPDVKPSSGSGVVLRLEDQRVRLFSNDHVLCAARQHLEDQRTSDWPFDIASTDLALFRRVAGDGVIPEARLTSEEVTNQTLADLSVEIYGVGGDLFRFKGKPFRIPFTVPSLGETFGERVLFGLRIPTGFLHHPSEIAGMSGSPVLLARDGSVVGLVARVHYSSDGKTEATSIIFAGPDELRSLTKRSGG